MQREPLRGDGDIPPAVIGLPALAKMAFDGVDLAPVWNSLVERVTARPSDAAALLDLSTIAHLQGRPDDRKSIQAMALELQRVYRQPAVSANPAIKLLALMAPGDFMANMPIEFLLKDAAIALDMIYIMPERPLPDPLPAHDVAVVAVAESDENQPLLAALARRLETWPRPVINAPAHIARLTRRGTSELLRSAPGVAIPMNERIDHKIMVRIALGDVSIQSVLPGSAFPIIARPAHSHAGLGLSKLDYRADIGPYLADRPEADFYIAPFVDYKSPDGLYRKYRVALIGGRPYACHMAISKHWMIHYLNADMKGSAAKRAEEAQFMASFDDGFALRHAQALDAIAERAALDYLPFDCAETRDGRLLVFESGTNMIVHSMDPPDLFPYKGAQMEKVFAAFAAMVRSKLPGR